MRNVPGLIQAPDDAWLARKRKEAEPEKIRGGKWAWADAASAASKT